MKTFFCFLFVFAPVFSAFSALDKEPEQKSAREIRIIIAQQPSPHTHRSNMQAVDAWYDIDAENIEVEFNGDFGSVTIYLMNAMSQPIMKYECNTSFEEYVFIPCNGIIRDIRMIEILGTDFEAIGYLDEQE